LYGQYDNVEIWKRHPEFQHYEVSTIGRVRSSCHTDRLGRLHRGLILKPALTGKHGDKRQTVCIHSDGYRIMKRVHSLVLETFVGPRPVNYECCHGVGGANDNSLANLCYGTRSKNMGCDRVRDGTDNRGSRNGRSKLTEEQVIRIRERLRNNETQRVIATDFNVSEATISEIKTGKTRIHGRDYMDMSIRDRN
jgi:hypothetical protein